MEKSTASMAMFNSYVSLPEGSVDGMIPVNSAKRSGRSYHMCCGIDVGKWTLGAAWGMLRLACRGDILGCWTKH